MVEFKDEGFIGDRQVSNTKFLEWEGSNDEVDLLICYFCGYGAEPEAAMTSYLHFAKPHFSVTSIFAGHRRPGRL